MKDFLNFINMKGGIWREVCKPWEVIEFCEAPCLQLCDYFDNII